MDTPNTLIQSFTITWFHIHFKILLKLQICDFHILLLIECEQPLIFLYFMFNTVPYMIYFACDFGIYLPTILKNNMSDEI